MIPTNDNNMTDEDFEDEIISKTQIKRELQALRDLGKELVELTPAQLEKMPISEDLLSNLLDAKRFTKKALKRQLQHIGVIMRDEDAEAIRKALDRIYKPQKEEVKVFHEIEKWRDGLLADEEGLINEITARFNNVDHQYINQLIRNAKKEKEHNKSPKSARNLFKYLVKLKTGLNNA